MLFPPRFLLALATSLAALSSAPRARAQTGALLDHERPDEPQPQPAPAPGDPGRRSALWIQPLAPIVGPAGRWYNLNLGYSRSLGRGMDLVLDGGLGYAASVSSGVATFGVSGGVAFLLTGDRPLHGLFVLPKFHVDLAPMGTSSGNTAVVLGPGFDIGYQATLGDFYIAPLVGVTYNLMIPTDGNPVSYASGLNLALLRVGYAWDAPETRAAASEGFDLVRDRRPRDRAVWITPAWMAIGPLVGRYNLGLGANLPLTGRASAVLEAGVEWGSETGSTGTRGNYTSLQAAVGVAFALTGRGELDGLFVQPKIHAATYDVGSFGGLSPAMIAGGAVDLGYHLTIGPLYLAPVVGLGLSWITLENGSPGTSQPRGLQPYFNATLLRMGLAF